MDRDEAIKRIRAALKRRSGKAWSVTGGRGTDYGWIEINAPPSRRERFGCMNAQDQIELARLLGMDRVHSQGEIIPASNDYRQESEGREPSVRGKQYWD